MDHVTQLHKHLVGEKTFGDALLLQRQGASITGGAAPEEAVESAIVRIVQQALELVLPQPVNAALLILCRQSRVGHGHNVNAPALDADLTDRRQSISHDRE